MIVSAQKLATNTQFKAYLNNDFNSVTAENDMKMRSIFIGPNNYDFSKGDAIISYAKQNGFRVFGHALISEAIYKGLQPTIEAYLSKLV